MREIKYQAWYNGKMYAINMIIWYSETNIVYGLTDPKVPGSQIHVGMNEALVREYVGLKDRNGKEVYEGDIVHDPLTGKRYPVVFENGAFRANGLVVCNAFPNDEVIGNIYENSELR